MCRLDCWRDCGVLFLSLSLLADVLAEMAVWQTREWFMKEHGFIVDNP